jgi:hypothetical protein
MGSNQSKLRKVEEEERNGKIRKEEDYGKLRRNVNMSKLKEKLACDPTNPVFLRVRPNYILQHYFVARKWWMLKLIWIFKTHRRCPK